MYYALYYVLSLSFSFFLSFFLLKFYICYSLSYHYGTTSVFRAFEDVHFCDMSIWQKRTCFTKMSKSCRSVVIKGGKICMTLFATIFPLVNNLLPKSLLPHAWHTQLHDRLTLLQWHFVMWRTMTSLTTSWGSVRFFFPEETTVSKVLIIPEKTSSCVWGKVNVARS